MAVMKDTDFINISSTLRIKEKSLLDTAAIDRMVDSGSLQEALRMLSQNTDYDFTGGEAAAGYEQRLSGELQRVYEYAYRSTGHHIVVDILACKYDYHNLKTALKALYFPQRTPPPYIAASRVEAEVIEELVRKDRQEQAPGYLVEACKEAKAAFEASQNPQDLDLVPDRLYFAHLIKLCGEAENEFITGYVTLLIDFYNIKTLLRVKNMQRGSAFLAECLASGGRTPTTYFLEQYNKAPSAMVPVFYYQYFGEAMRLGVEAYEKNGNFAGLERVLDNCLIEYSRQAKYIAFGPEILFAYLLSKENEIRQVRILLGCKANQIPPEILKERLRENYA